MNPCDAADRGYVDAVIAPSADPRADRPGAAAAAHQARVAAPQEAREHPAVSDHEHGGHDGHDEHGGHDDPAHGPEPLRRRRRHRPARRRRRPVRRAARVRRHGGRRPRGVRRDRGRRGPADPGARVGDRRPERAAVRPDPRAPGPARRPHGHVVGRRRARRRRRDRAATPSSTRSTSASSSVPRRARRTCRSTPSWTWSSRVAPTWRSTWSTPGSSSASGVRPAAPPSRSRRTTTAPGRRRRGRRRRDGHLVSERDAHVQVVRGTPDDLELAALVAGLMAAASERARLAEVTRPRPSQRRGRTVAGRCGAPGWACARDRTRGAGACAADAHESVRTAE